MFKIFTKFLLIFGIFVIANESINAQEKYYIMFDSMEDQKANTTGIEITNLIDLCYWDRLAEHPDFADYIVREPLTPATLSKYDLIQMDVAIFLLSQGRGLTHVEKGIKIYDKVKEMLDAGKRVAIIGHNILSKDLESDDEEVKDFWYETLGVADYHTMDLGSYPNNEHFEVRGQGPPIAQEWAKRCNQIFGRNGVEPQAPIRWYSSAEFFSLKDDALAIPLDRLVIPDKLDNKTVYSGLRAEIGSGKLAIWTLNYDIASGVDLSHFGTALRDAMHWFTDENEIPTPYSFLKFSPFDINYEKVDLEEKSVRVASVKNFGKESFTITDVYVDPNSETPDGFSILDSDLLPVTLDTYEEQTFRIEFAPTQKIVYDAEVIIESDAERTQSNPRIFVRGGGGFRENFGPEIDVTDFPMDFGKVDRFKKSDLPLEIFNTGTEDLIVEAIEFNEDAQEIFFFADVYSPPYVVQEGDRFSIDVRFVPDAENSVYKGQIEIISNAVNIQHGATYVDLIGKSNPSFKGAEIQYDTDVMEFGVVDSSKIMTVTMQNNGDRPLYVQQPQIEADPENLEVFEILDKEVPAIPPELSEQVRVKFTPVDTKEYFADLVIVSNSKLYGVKRIPMGGFGSEMVSVEEDGVAGVRGLFEMSLNPNPANENSTLEYTLSGNTARNVNMVILDASGKQVAELHEGNLNPGTYTTQISALNLASGTYVIAANISKNYKAVLNFVIVK